MEREKGIEPKEGQKANQGMARTNSHYRLVPQGFPVSL
jgi:hypothetical protein